MRNFSIVTKTMDVDNKRACYTTKYSLLGMPVMRRTVKAETCGLSETEVIVRLFGICLYRAHYYDYSASTADAHVVKP